MGSAGVKQDEEVMSFLLQNTRAEDSIYVASPYLNLTEKYRDLILTGLSKVEVITAAPHVCFLFSFIFIDKSFS